MDWDDVTLEDLVDALKEVDWSIPPRPLGEFFGKFSVPKNDSKWEARFRCNLFYYRTNYVILVGSVFVLAFVRNPLALGAVSVTGLSVACLNDSFAITLSEKLTRAVRQISPPLGRRLQAPKVQAPKSQAPVTRPQGRLRKRTVYICGQERRFFVAALASVGALLCWRSSAIVTVCGASIVALSLPMLHASFRTPNVKSRLNALQEDIRAALQGYKDS